MVISNIKVGGFRNIRSFDVELSNLTGLVGTNGYGKSNAIDAIDFGFDFLHAAPDGKSDLMHCRGCIPLLKINAGQNYSLEIGAQITSKKYSYLINYGFEFAWGTEQQEAKVLNEYLQVKADEKNQKFNTYIKRADTLAQIRTSPTGRCDKKIKIEPNELVINKLMAFDELFYYDIVRQINLSQVFVEKHLDASSSYLPNPFVIKGMPELELRGIDSIPRAVFTLKKKFPEKYELLCNAFMQLFPNILSISVNELKLNENSKFEISTDAPVMYSDTIYTMSILDSRLVQPINFERLSDGTKRIFLVLVFAVIANIKNISAIAVEEPENSIHPSLFQCYLDVLTQLSGNCKILISSHSPYVIQYMEPRNILIGLPSETGEVRFKKIAPQKVRTLYKDAMEYDRSVGDYIFNLLSTNDAEDFLQEYLEQ